jgi:hypothetical protein
MGRPSRRSITNGAPVLGVVVLLLGALTWPLLFTYSGFSGDWEQHLWLMWHQSRSIQSDHFPSLFINDEYGVFYPIYAFYGGTIYAVGGVLSLALGGAPVTAYVLIFVVDFLAAFGGWYWLGRMAGVGRWQAIVPGLIFITSAYYMLVLYVQGDWAEFTGVSMIPLMVAAGLSVLRSERMGLGPAVALGASGVLFFGAHNITILLGLTTLGIIGVAAVTCIPDARGQVSRKGVIRVVGVLVPAGMVSAWFLLPALAYASHMHTGHDIGEAREALTSTAGLVSMRHIFSLSRASVFAGNLPYPFPLTLPVLAMAWVLVGAVTLPWGASKRNWRRFLLICCATCILVIVTMTHVGLLLALPHFYWLIQFSYRLEAYVLLTLCAAILAGFALARNGSRWARVWVWMAVPICAVSLIDAVQQIRAYPYPGEDRYAVTASYGAATGTNNTNYLDDSEPVIAARGLRTIAFSSAAIHDDSLSWSNHLPAGTRVVTNIDAGRYLLNITGAKAVGIDSEHHRMVLEIGSGATGTVTVSPGHSLPIVLGRLLTLCGLAILGLELLVLLSRRARQRWRARPLAQVSWG